MSIVEGHEDDPKQPTITSDGGFIWPGDEGTKRKAAPGVYVIDKYLTPTTIGEPIGISVNGDHSEEDHDHEHHSDEESTSAGFVVSVTATFMLVGASIMMI